MINRFADGVRRWAAVAAAGACAGAMCATALAAPAQMKAIVEHGTGGPEVVRLETLPVPEPGPNQVRIRVYAAAINPVDWEIRSGAFGPPRRGGAAGAPPAPAPLLHPGIEVAGVIDALGPGVSEWKRGQAVFGEVANGSAGYAQYTLADTDDIAPKPRRMSYEQAAGASVGGLTAMRTVRETHVGPGTTVAVVGAAGGVGSAVVELAKARGATVIAVASSRHNAYLKKIGADRIINYDKGPADAAGANADVVINTAPGQADAALAYAKRGGTVVSIIGPPSPAQCAAAGVNCPPDRGGRVPGAIAKEELAQISKLADEGKFTVQVEKTFPLAQAAEAQEFNRAGHAQGKVVLVVAAGAAAH
ncbi:MAG TPA: NADP-dependent oxidoreductase [Steroidobacteraceae bacterium]|jgi:NADPH:quinone reductase-like Zn-dependent oxidoreductase|nr:NADP-dependent oxidoreductase [Steroidobacteraceae bacterium]